MATDKAAPKSKNLKKDKDLVQQVTRQLKASFDATSDLRREMKEDMGFSIGGKRQWDEADLQKLAEEKRPAMSFNNIHPAINLLCGIEEDRHQDRRYLPKGAEDEFVGRIATSLVKNLEDQGARFEETIQFRKGSTCGLNVLKVYHTFEFTDDLIEGDVRAVSLETNTWYCDPRARLYNRIDARYQGELIWMDSDEINANWPGHEKRMDRVGDWLPYEPTLTGMPEHFIKELYDKERDLIRVLRHYYRVPVTVTLLVNTAAPAGQSVQRVKDGKTAEDMIRQIHDNAGAAAAAPFQVYQTNQAFVVQDRRNAQNFMPVMTAEEGQQIIDNIRAQAGRQAASQYDILSRDTTAIRCAHLTGYELLDDTPFEDFDSWRFPYSPYICFQDEDGLDSIKGIVRDAKDPQRVSNWSMSTMMDTLARGPKGQTWLPKEGNHDLTKIKREISKAGFVGEYSGQLPTYYPPGSFSPGELAMVEFGLDANQRVMNMGPEVMGQSTQATVSGRAKVAAQSGSLTGLGHIFKQWKQTQTYTGLLYIKAIQQHYSVEKIDRIIGQDARMGQLLGVPMPKSVEDQYAAFKKVRDIDMDVKVGFQEASQTAREANFTRLMQLGSLGMPIPPEALIEAADVPYRDEINAKLQTQGMGQPNQAMLQALGASQGQGAAAGINKT